MRLKKLFVIGLCGVMIGSTVVGCSKKEDSKTVETAQGDELSGYWILTEYMAGFHFDNGNVECITFGQSKMDTYKLDNGSIVATGSEDEPLKYSLNGDTLVIDSGMGVSLSYKKATKEEFEALKQTNGESGLGTADNSNVVFSEITLGDGVTMEVPTETKDTTNATTNTIVNTSKGLLDDISVPTTLSALESKFGKGSTSGDKTIFTTSEGTVTAVVDNGKVYNIRADFDSTKYQENIDSSKIDKNKTYSYSEACKTLGGNGVVTSRYFGASEEYTVTWYSKDAKICSITFIKNTDTSKYIYMS